MKLTPLVNDGLDNRLGVMRLGFALLVLLSHSYPLSRGSDGGEPILELTRGQITGGSLAVDAFFAISGFLIAASWVRSRGLLDYLGKRSLRIYPGFIVACGFCAVVAGPLGADSVAVYRSNFSRKAFLLNVLALDGSLLPRTLLGNPYPNAVNGSLWTIRYEFICYLFIGLLGVAGLLRKRLVLTLLAASFAILCWYDLRHGSYRYISRGENFGIFIPYVGYPSVWARFSTFFLVGSAAYLWRDSIPRSPSLAVASLLALTVGIFVAPAFALLLPICGVYLLFWVAFSPSSGKGLSDPDLSYGVYLYAFPIQQLIVAWMPGVHPLVLAALAIPPTLALATASWYGIERRAINLKRYLPRRKVSSQRPPEPETVSRSETVPEADSTFPVA